MLLPETKRSAEETESQQREEEQRPPFDQIGAHQPEIDASVGNVFTD